MAANVDICAVGAGNTVQYDLIHSLKPSFYFMTMVLQLQRWDLWNNCHDQMNMLEYAAAYAQQNI